MYCLSRICVRNNLRRINKLQNIKYSSEVIANSALETYKHDTPRKKLLKVGPNLKDFLTRQSAIAIENTDVVPYLTNTEEYGQGRKVLFEVYGCQMNVNDTEIIWSILKKNNYLKTDDLDEADIVLLITCAIRDGAEQKIWNRLNYLRGIREKKKAIKGFAPMKVGLLGCMAERLKQKVLEIDKSVDIVAGPDSYKDLPRLLSLADENETAINVVLSFDETYADVMPVRLNENSVSAFVSIMRGCDNMCTYCIVPFTRGRERSRPVNSILNEIRHLSEQGVKEVTLLGQNVNSYRDVSDGSKYYMAPNTTNLAKGFKTVYKNKFGGLRFADLLEKAAEVDPEMRIRFTSPHPKDFPDEVLQLINSKPNICKNLHMPAQSGNSNVLERMRRGYTREAYLELIDRAKTLIPTVSLSSDFICGFCGETEKEFEETLTLMERVRYNMAYLFMYSMREKTTAHRRLKDDVPLVVKHERLVKMSNLYRELADENNKAEIERTQLVLVEGSSRRSDLNLQGRTDGNLKVIFPAGSICDKDGFNHKEVKPGDYLAVKICDANSQVLKGIPLYHTTLTRYHCDGN